MGKWKTFSIEDAKEKNLKQQTIWIKDSKTNREVIERARTQVLINPKRTAIICQRGSMISLWVDPIA